MKRTVLVSMLLVAFVFPISSTQAQTPTNTALIQKLLAQIAVLQAELNKLRGITTTPSCTFTRTLYQGIQGNDVTCLQNYLKKKGHFTGTATGFYGPLTRDAVYKWQQSAGIVPEPKAIGMFGPRSQELFMREASVVIPPNTDPDPITPDTDISDEGDDTTPPSTPTNLTATLVSKTDVTLSWSASTDNTRVERYRVYQDGTEIATARTTSYTVSNLSPSTTYVFTISAYDRERNTSTKSSPLSVTTLANTDTTPPTIPTNVSATANSASQITLTWGASTDSGSGLKGYHIYRTGNTVPLNPVPQTGTTYINTGLTASTPYSYQIEAVDIAGNKTAKTASVSATTQAPLAIPDTTKPTTPGTPTISLVTQTTLRVSWTAATDAGGSNLSGYRLYRNGVQIGTPVTTTYNDTGLSSATAYSYTVVAYDGAGNVSLTSGARSTTTLNEVIVPPVVPPVTQNFTDVTTTLTGNEGMCGEAGWKKITTTIGGHERELLYKGPASAWRGSIIVMHGGGGDYTQWCYNSAPAIKPQVDFSTIATARGFGVFLLESTNDVVTDANGRVCGKRFDATVVDGRSTNVDLPFIERVITDIIPAKRVSGSSPSIFVTGESIGGYMTTRAATHFDNLVTAFAPAASGDPYGTYFDCNPALSPRDTAKGAGFDRETNTEIIMPNSCVSASYPNEKPWETMSPSKKPAFKTFHSADDGVADLSCREKVATQLRVHGYSDDGAYVIPSSGTRSVWAHFWQSAYNRPVLDFFAKYSE